MAYAVAGSYLERWLAPDYGWPGAGPRARRRDPGLDDVAKPRKAGGWLEVVRSFLTAARA